MRLILLYLFLVGMPILGVLAILRLGENLTPPVSVGGAWNIEISSQTGDNLACSNPLMSSQQPILTISQSGPRLLLIFNDPARTTLIGEIHEATITARTPGHGANATADETARLYLEARVDRQTEPDRLQGTFAFSSQCSLQTMMSFTALRQHRGG